MFRRLVSRFGHSEGGVRRVVVGAVGALVVFGQ